jgi:hypothetical protein
LGGPGYFLVLAPAQHELPRPARAYWLTDQAVSSVAGRPGVQRPALDLARLTLLPAQHEPPEGPYRPAAVMFTGDVLKDILGNTSYRGKVLVDGELIDAKHPPLVDDATWEACVAVRGRNQRRSSKTWTRHSYH